MGVALASVLRPALPYCTWHAPGGTPEGSWPSTREPPVPEPSCSLTTARSWARRRRRSLSTILNQAGWSTIRRISGPRSRAAAGLRLGLTGLRGGRPRCHRHRQPAGDRPSVGCGDRSPPGERHRLAVPAHSGAVRRAGGGRLRRTGGGAHRTAPGPLLQRHQARMAACRTGRVRQDLLRGGRLRAGTHRQFPHVAAHRRPRPCDRLQQRLQDHVAGPAAAWTGRTNWSLCSGVPRRVLPELVSFLRRRSAATDPGAFRGGRSHRRHRGRPAGGPVRPGWRSRRADSKNTYGTGCFLLVNTGRRARAPLRSNGAAARRSPGYWADPHGGHRVALRPGRLGVQRPARRYSGCATVWVS